MASAAPLNQVERSRGLLCKLGPWLKSSALKYWMINQREGVQYLGIWKTCLFPTLAKFYLFLNVFEKSTTFRTNSSESLLPLRFLPLLEQRRRLFPWIRILFDSLKRRIFVIRKIRRPFSRKRIQSRSPRAFFARRDRCIGDRKISRANRRPNGTDVIRAVRTSRAFLNAEFPSHLDPRYSPPPYPTADLSYLFLPPPPPPPLRAKTNWNYTRRFPFSPLILTGTICTLYFSFSQDRC